jgi:hypothetical protein
MLEEEGFQSEPEIILIRDDGDGDGDPVKAANLGGYELDKEESTEDEAEKGDENEVIDHPISLSNYSLSSFYNLLASLLNLLTCRALVARFAWRRGRVLVGIDCARYDAATSLDGNASTSGWPAVK